MSDQEAKEKRESRQSSPAKERYEKLTLRPIELVAYEVLGSPCSTPAGAEFC